MTCFPLDLVNLTIQYIDDMDYNNPTERTVPVYHFPDPTTIFTPVTDCPEELVKTIQSIEVYQELRAFFGHARECKQPLRKCMQALDEACKKAMKSTLMLGIEYGCLKIVQYSYEKGEKLDGTHQTSFPSPWGIGDLPQRTSPIVKAAALESPSILQFLIDKGVKVPVRNDDNQPSHCFPLQAAISNNRKHNFTLLMDQRCDLEKQDNIDCTALHRAVRSINERDNSLDFVQKLVASKANLNATDGEGRTPLYYTIHFNSQTDRQIEIIKILLTNGAQYRTPIQIALTLFRNPRRILGRDDRISREIQEIFLRHQRPAFMIQKRNIAVIALLAMYVVTKIKFQ